MPLYEHVFIARQDVSGAQVDEIVNTFTGVVESGGGKVVETESWGLRNLTYRIKKNRKGHYVLMNIECNHEALAELEQNFKFNDAVLRHLVFGTKKAITSPSPMMKEDKAKSLVGDSKDEVVVAEVEA